MGKTNSAKKYRTDNGVEITPGLRVLTNDWEWGTVDPAQFESGGSMDPAGEFFDGWFDVTYGDDAPEEFRGRTKSYNGERMTTSQMHKKDPAPRPVKAKEGGVERSVEIHLLNYRTHAVVVHVTHAPVGDIAEGWAEPTADGGEMLRTWHYHHTMEGAHKAVMDDASMSEDLGDKVTIVHHRPTKD